MYRLVGVVFLRAADFSHIPQEDATSVETGQKSARLRKATYKNAHFVVYKKLFRCDCKQAKLIKVILHSIYVRHAIYTFISRLRRDFVGKLLI